MWEQRAPRAEVKRADRLQGRKVVVLLEDAVLELAKGRQGSLQLLEGLQHRRLLQQEDRDSTDVRPDIVHHCLLTLQESPLNKVGCILTRDRQLIEVHPQLRVPSTYEEFRKLMVNLLHTRRIRAVERNVTLLQVTKNDPNLFLPVGSRKIGEPSGAPYTQTEYGDADFEATYEYYSPQKGFCCKMHSRYLAYHAFSSKGRPVDLEDFVQQFQHTESPVLFLVGAVAHANPTANSELAEECISIAPCGLSAAAELGIVPSSVVTVGLEC
ncbi:nucleolar essential protein 1, putative [Eimeria mitis]|uniref:Nucleolar essential protein 1, putative n=1 Tax=Eimeria mitis TaxID=44415 RepID=U6KHU9_9EIME|nr:nucleolar essential protein 1, putative [Eimeria mitis]CDJ35043.1 nucleolar essential protein 1, putative [Eimeria mitis]